MILGFGGRGGSPTRLHNSSEADGVNMDAILNILCCICSSVVAWARISGYVLISLCTVALFWAFAYASALCLAFSGFSVM